MSYLKKVIISLILLFVLIGVVSILTKAHEALIEINLLSFTAASAFFIASVLVWIAAWAFLIKKEEAIPFSQLLLVGFSSVFGALTPVQVGAEALRSLKLKHYFNVSYTKSVSASMVVKGGKFLMLAIFASFVLLFYSIQALSGINPLVFFGFTSGFLVVVSAAALFLLPLHKDFGIGIANFFHEFSKNKSYLFFLKKLGTFFEDYSKYLTKTSMASFIVVFVLSFISLMLEFLALHYSFLAFHVSLPLQSTLVLLIIVSVLERTPFLPRGIGLIELVSYNYLAFPVFSKTTALTVSSIGGVLIIYAVVRLVIPTILSLTTSAFYKTFKNPQKLKKNKVKQRTDFLNSAPQKQEKQGIQSNNQPNNQDKLPFL